MNILACNGGSQTVKCSLFEGQIRYQFVADRIHDQPHYTISEQEQTILTTSYNELGHASALTFFLNWVQEQHIQISACGHRVVHGGPSFSGPVLVNDNNIQKLKGLIPLAPLHQPFNIELIEIILKQCPHIPQVACFDTAFHHQQPWLAKQFALPKCYSEQVIRYGFHGLSYEYISKQLDQAFERVIVMHLGGGASACAILKGKSIASTMSFTALDGLMMATRCGSLDPGVILYLLNEQNKTAKEIETLLYKESGLLGVSGISQDMRDLHASDALEAKQAIDLFCYRVAKEVGGLIAVLGGVDALVFTGGIGLNDPISRLKICDYFKWLNVKLDVDRNNANSALISSPDRLPVMAIATCEDATIVDQTRKVLNGQIV